MRFSVLNQWRGHLLKQEPECGDPTSWWGPVSTLSTSPVTCLREAGGPQFQFSLIKAELPSARLVGNTGSECLCSVEGRMPCWVCFRSESSGETWNSFPWGNLSHPGLCLACSGRASHHHHLGTGQSSGKGGKGRESFPHSISVHIGVWTEFLSP